MIVNLDKKIDLLTPLVKNVTTKLVYKHEPSDGTGIILRISKASCGFLRISSGYFKARSLWNLLKIFKDFEKIF